MGTTAEKINRLTQTKSDLKTVINYTGANVTDETTFKEYPKLLNKAYIDILNDEGESLYNALPKVTGTGSNLTLNTEEGKMNITLKGDTTQDGIPTADYSQDINVVTGEQNVKIRGNNLYNYNDTTNISPDVTVDNEGWITISYDNTSGTSNIYENYYTNNLDLKLNTSYAIFCEIKNVEGNGNLNLISHINNQGQFNANPAYEFSTLNNNEIKKTIATTYNDTNRTNGLRTYVRFNAGVSGSITFRISVLEDIDLSINDFVYEPYQSQNYPINLNDIELCKIGDYQDYIYNQNGDWYLHKEIGKVILNGSSNESYAYQNNHRFWLRRPYWTNETVPKNPPNNWTKIGLFCNRFVERTASETWSRLEGISYDGPNTADQPIGSTFDIACNSVATNVNDFKTWLSNNPLEVVYILQNIQDTQITDTTLIQQLGNLKNAKSYDNVTNIIQTNDNVPFVLEISALAKIE